MALDGSGAASARTLSNREAALLYGQGWECSETGANVRQCLTLNAISVAELTGEEQALARATRLLRRRRLEVQFGLEQLRGRLASLRAFPLMRLAARKSFADLQAQLAVHEQMLKELPQRPVVERLDPEGDSGLPSGALKLGATIWFVHKKTQQLFSGEVAGAAIEKLDGPVLVYDTRGPEENGKALRRTVAHFMDGLKTLSAPEMAFMDPLSAREFLKMISPAPVELAAAAPIKAAPIAAAPTPTLKPAPRVSMIAPPPAGTPVDPDLHSIALEPFDESLLK